MSSASVVLEPNGGAHARKVQIEPFPAGAILEHGFHASLEHMPIKGETVKHYHREPLPHGLIGYGCVSDLKFHMLIGTLSIQRI